MTVRTGIPRSCEAPLALAGLIVLSPLLVVIGALIACSSRGPIIFRQHRVGRHGKHFVLFKFRTMRVQQSGLQITARDDDRMTSVGRFLRKTKMDELPELLNIVKGEMSLVGPRPEVPRYVDANDPLWQEILRVRPGITDPVTLALRNEEQLLAEVKGDRESFYRDVLQPFKLRGYADYLRRRSWRSDVGVIAHTLWAVVFPSQATRLSRAEFAEPAINCETRGRI